MSGVEWVVIIVCAMLGYGLVSWLSSRQARHEETMRHAADESEGQSNRQEERHSREQRANSHPQQESWFHVLEVPPSASWEQIRSEYRKKIQQYHPDRLEGMAAELRQLAVERCQRLNAAYEEAKRLKATSA